MASTSPGSSQHTLPASDNKPCQSLDSECRATCNRDLEIGMAWMERVDGSGLDIRKIRIELGGPDAYHAHYGRCFQHHAFATGGALVSQLAQDKAPPELESALTLSTLFPVREGVLGSRSGGGILRYRTIFDRLIRGFLFSSKTWWDGQAGGHC